MQQFTSAQLCPHPQSGGTPFFDIHIRLADGEHLVHGELSFADDEARHQFRQGSDGQHSLLILAEQDFLGILIDDQGNTGLQCQFIMGSMQAGQQAKKKAWTTHARNVALGHIGRLEILRL